MRDTDYIKVLEFQIANGILHPVNDRAVELCASPEGNIVEMLSVTPRDGRFHRAYFKFIATAWTYFPANKKPCKQENFYNYLKLVQNAYDCEYVEVHGMKVPMFNYVSISYPNMDEVVFETFVKNQVPCLYEEFHKAFKGYIDTGNPVEDQITTDKIVNDIIFNLEEDFKRIMLTIR